MKNILTLQISAYLDNWNLSYSILLPKWTTFGALALVPWTNITETEAVCSDHMGAVYTQFSCHLC